MIGWRAFLRNGLKPPASEDRHDTGLRFTDVLFGFVIRELFVRLQHWGTLPSYVRWQLIVGAVLVLGSWIGFRRSLNRTKFDVKFFNVPLARFVLDQAMIVFYFRVATQSPDSAHPKVHPDPLAQATVRTLFLIFVLYLAWDVCALWMGKAAKYRAGGAKVDLPGFWITSALAGAFAALYWVWTAGETLGPSGAIHRFWVAIVLMVLYRWLKELKTSNTPQPPLPSELEPSVAQ